jgi:4-amino-4-deoxy-L-arabinose transferase-like glycosyltransferase
MPATAASTSPRTAQRAHRTLAVVVLVALGLLAAFVAFYRLGDATWLSDELFYRDAARSYMDGDFSVNRENTLLAKYILGVVQLVFGSGHVAVRAPAAVAGLLTGVALLLLGRRMAGLWAGIVAFALWCLLPRPEVIGEWDVGRIQIERYFRLEVFAALFATVALLAAWHWAENGRWRSAVTAGVAVGLAAASKAPGILVLPAVVLVGLVSLPRGPVLVKQSLAVAALPFLVVAITYVPLGTDAFDAIDGMFYVDSLRNNTFNTPFVFFGDFYDRTPWWANLWWQWKSLGTPAAIAVACCLALAPFLLPRRALLLLGVALLVPLFFFLVRLRYALPYYYYAWQPQLMLVCALVLSALATRGRIARLGAAALAVPLVVAAAGTVRDVAQAGPRDFTAAARELGPTLRSGSVVTWGFEANNIMRSVLPGATILLSPKGVKDISAIVVDPAISTRRPSVPNAAYLRANRERLVLRRFDRLRVYLPRDRTTRRSAAGS